MNLLVVDRGNTRVKIAAFAGKNLLCVESFDHFAEQDLAHFVDRYPCESAIIGSSGGEVEDILGWLRKLPLHPIVKLDHQTPISLQINYSPRSSLGVDRIATAMGARDLLPDEDLLIFDLGTAITVDHVSADGQFRGGNISPGLAMRFAALHQFTCRLPLIEAGDWDRDSRKFALSTHEAIYRGVINGICHEIEGYIAENPDKRIFFTGGDALFFEKRIKKAIFANQQATLCGLRVILETICSNE